MAVTSIRTTVEPHTGHLLYSEAYALFGSGIFIGIYGGKRKFKGRMNK